MIHNLPFDGTLPTDIVCSHNRNRFHDSPFHQHSDHIELYLFMAGDATFYTKKQAFPLKRGYLLAIPNGVWHRAVTHDSSPYERIFLNISVPLIKALSTTQTDLFRCFKTNNDDEIRIYTLNETTFDRFVSLCDQLISTLNQTHFGNDISQRILLSQILLLVNQIRQIKQPPQNIIPPFLEKVTHFIDDNLAKDLSLATFGQHFYLNPNYLDRNFKNYMGLTLHQYVTERRLELAKRLLKSGKNVTETCSECGFGNYSNFIRLFTHQVGISPGKYKKQIGVRSIRKK